MMHCVAIQGPPRSGKDTAGFYIKTEFEALGYHAILCKAAGWLKTTVAKHAFGEFPVMNEADIERVKDQLIPGRDITFRQALICFSEQYAKPMFGADFFGKKLVEQMLVLEANYTEFYGMHAKEVVFVMTDAGFEEEQIPVQNCMGKEFYSIVQMHREGCDYSYDSRSYFCLNGSRCEKLHNNEALDILALKCGKIAKGRHEAWTSIKGQ